MIESHYYIGTGPEALALIEECKKGLLKKQAAIIKLVSKYKAKNVLMQGDKVVGLAFDVLPDDWKSYLKKPDSIKNNGNTFLCCAPRKNTYRGKVLAEEMESGEIAFSPHDYIIEHTNTKHMVYDGIRLAFSSAGYKDDKVLLRIPFGNIDGEKIPNPPQWFKEVTVSEFTNARPKKEATWQKN